MVAAALESLQRIVSGVNSIFAAMDYVIFGSSAEGYQR